MALLLQVWSVWSSDEARLARLERQIMGYQQRRPDFLGDSPWDYQHLCTIYALFMNYLCFFWNISWDGRNIRNITSNCWRINKHRAWSRCKKGRDGHQWGFQPPLGNPLVTSWRAVGDRKSELTELEALHMRYVRMNHIDISYTQRFMITRCLYLSVSKYVIYIYIMSIYAHTRSYRFFYRSLPTCSRCALSSLATESWVVRSRNHVFSSWTSPQLRVSTFLVATIWLFNIAMENHHF